MHSATKFLGGHSDALGGVLCGREELVDKVFEFREINGATLDANSAYLLVRGLKTLKLRIDQQSANAVLLAEFLESHPAIERVFYPGLTSHPQHELAKRHMRSFGGMLSFSLKGDFSSVREFLPRLQLAHRAAHLGGVETIVGPPRTTSHVELSQEQRLALGIPETLIRCSVGIEGIEDIKEDFGQALAGIS